jgi:uncharacterized protein YlxP (DUF503 family)
VRHPPGRLQRPARGRRLRGLRDARGRAHLARRARPDGRLRLARRVIAGGFVAVLAVELHFPEAGSLKGKRKYVKSAKAQLQNRFGASVAEVGHHELWQRCALTAAFVARDAGEAEDLADRAASWLAGQEWELVRADRMLVSPDDELGEYR